MCPALAMKGSAHMSQRHPHKPPPVPPALMHAVSEPQPPSVMGQLVLAAAQIDVGQDQQGQPMLVVTPHGTGLQVVVPLGEAAARTIGQALLAKRVVLPPGGPLL